MTVPSPRKPVFDAVRAICPPGLFDDPGNVLALDNLLDAFGAARIAAHKLADPGRFFAAIAPTTKALSEIQTDTINGLLKQAAHWPIGWLAYGLATAWHEALLMPIREIGRGGSRAYARPGKYGQAQYGRGLVQLTWDKNYEWADHAASAAGVIPKGALLADFDLALRPDLAAFILVRGMETGAFTGKSLSHCLPTPEAPTHGQFVEARRIINGTDRAQLVADYAARFLSALKSGGWA